MSVDVERRREREKRVVTEMITLYCQKHKHTKMGICKECQEIKDYAMMRSDKCPFMETKTFCSNCKVHCYSPEMRKKIKEIMKYSGPRMILRRPYLTMRHVVDSCIEKRKLKHT